MKTNTYKYLLAISALMILSCGSKTDSTEQTNNTISVNVATVNSNSTNPFLALSGKIQAVQSADISTRFMGFVSKTHVNVGDKVKKGQLLLEINNTDLQAKRAQVNAGITEAQAAYKNAEKDYIRFKNLYNEQSATQKEFDDMTAHFDMVKARLEAAKQMKNEINAQFDYSNIKAPFDGVITNKMIDEGDLANPGIPLLSIETPNQFEVITIVPETEITQVHQGIQVKVHVKSLDTIINGKVTEVSSSAKHTGGQFLTKIELEGNTEVLRTGMFATVQFPIEKTAKNDNVLIPLDAIITNGQLTGVYTVSQSNTAILRWLRLGQTFGDQIEVLSGLTSGETYIVTSESKLFNGAKLSIQ